MMKKFFYIPVLVILASCTKPVPTFHYVTSNGLGFWQETDLPAMTETHMGINTIIVNPTQTEQEIDGFGACFNELGWDALNMIPEEEKDSILRDFFSPEGFNFNICRVPIGANDYARDWYSLNETPGDFAMEHFSIERDRENLLPYIKLAMEYNPALKIWASPWCPPAWMKTNNHYACRPDEVNDLNPDGAGQEGSTQFIMEDEYLEAYALYFEKFVNAYREEGVNLYAVHVQNEPNSCQNFPSCVWTATDQARFIGDYLGPRFRDNGLDAEIWYGTYERPGLEKIDTILEAASGDFISGIGFQWAGKEAIAGIHEKYPEMSLMQTESECGDGSNDWYAAEYTWNLIRHYIESGANSYLYWNMVLADSGKSMWGWKQNSLISVDTAGNVTRNPEFYLFRHLTHYVRPGAKKIRTPEGTDNALLFLNPGNELVAIVVNTTMKATSVQLKVGEQFLIVQLLPHSFNTVTYKL